MHAYFEYDIREVQMDFFFLLKEKLTFFGRKNVFLCRILTFFTIYKIKTK